MQNRDKCLLQVISPFGEWPHPKGMQVVDEIAGNKMKKSFSIFSHFKSIPVYIGHPDDSPSHKKLKSIGKIIRIFTAHDGIMAEIQYQSDIFKKVLSKEFSALSPRWQMESLPNGKYRPIRLISVGLTNNPNIESSGKILSANHYISPVLYDSIKDLRKSIKQCQKSVGKIALCANSSAILAQKIKNLSLQDRILALHPNQNQQPKENFSAKDISRLVKQRMEDSGESYTKAFAFIKKKFPTFDTKSNLAKKKEQ